MQNNMEIDGQIDIIAFVDFSVQRTENCSCCVYVAADKTREIDYRQKDLKYNMDMKIDFYECVTIDRYNCFHGLCNAKGRQKEINDRKM